MIVGIDPDIDKSGIAYVIEGKPHIEMNTLKFVELMKFIRLHRQSIKCVYVEAGWINKKSSWHGAQNIAVAARIGKNVGENHAVGKLLIQCIEAEGLKVVAVKPSSTKLDAEQFAKLTGIKTRTNAESRDAAMLVFGR